MNHFLILNSKNCFAKFQDWGDLIRWKGQKTFQERFLTLAEFILSKEQVKILPECLQVQGGQKEPTKIPLCFRRNACEKTFFPQRLIL